MEFVENSFGSSLKLSREEQEQQFEKNIMDVLTRTRYILDNLDFFPTYEFNRFDYSNGNGRNRKFKQNPLYKKEKFFGVNESFNQTTWLYNGDISGNVD